MMEKKNDVRPDWIAETNRWRILYCVISIFCMVGVGLFAFNLDMFIDEEHAVEQQVFSLVMAALVITLITMGIKDFIYGSTCCEDGWANAIADVMTWFVLVFVGLLSFVAFAVYAVRFWSVDWWSVRCIPMLFGTGLFFLGVRSFKDY